MIVAHGEFSDGKCVDINIKTYDPHTKKWKDNIIKNGKDLNKFLSVNSQSWKNYKEGKVKAQDMHIVFYSCGSNYIVQDISKDENFKDITFIAPDDNVLSAPGGKSPVVGHQYKKQSGGKTNYPIINGEWHTYKNGSEPLINGNYPGSQELEPGTKNFNYEHTFF